MHGLYRRLIVLLFLMSASQAYAYPDSAGYRHYTIDNGLPSNNVYSCIQDRCGYIWFCTDNGIVKYNGYDFRLLNVTNAGLPDNDIFKMDKDGAGRIWLYSLTQHFGYIQDDRYYNVVPDKNKRIGYARAKRLNYTGNVTLYSIGAYEKKYLVIYGDSRHFFFIPTAYEPLCIDNGGILYFGFNNMIYAYSILNPLQPWKRIAGALKAPFLHPETHPLGVESINKGKSILFYEMSNHNFCKIDIESGNIKYNRPVMQPGEVIYVTASVPDNGYIILTNKNIFTIDDSLNFSKKTAIPPFIKDVQVAYAFADKNNANWYCTNGGGVWQNDNLPSLLMRDSSLTPLVQTRYAGAVNNAFSYWWNSKTHILYQLGRGKKMKNRHIEEFGRINYASAYDDSNAIITTGKESLLLNCFQGKYEQIFGTKRIIKDTSKTDYTLRSLLLEKRISEKKIVGFSVHNMEIYELSGDSVKVSFTEITGRRPDHMDEKPFLGYYLFCNNQDILIYNPVNDSLSFFPLQDLFGETVHKIYAVCHDRWNNLYLLTENKLLVVNPFNLQWRLLGSCFDYTNAHMCLSGDNLVLAGRFGVAAIHISGFGIQEQPRITLNIKNSLYKEVSGLWVSDDKTIVVQTDKAVFTANTDSVLKYGMRYEQLDACHFSFALNKPDNRLLKNGDTLQIDQQNNTIKIDAINFFGAGKVVYNYQLDNTTGWVQSGTSEIPVAGLEPGVYNHFKIKVSDDVWKSDVIDVVLYLPPYWWQTHNAHVFFLISISLILILAVIGIISLTRQAVVRAQARKRQMTELELRAVYSQINPHFIFNTLSTALYFIDRKDYDNAYKHVSKFSHLLRSYLKSSHDRYILLSEEVDMLKRYIELQQTRFENLFTYEIKVENRVPADHIQIPSLLLQPLIENAINHGLFHRKEPGGKLLISFLQGSIAEELICTIEDNGIGRMRAMDLKKTNDAERTSYGGKLTDKLVDIFRQYEAMNIHIEYVDKTEPETGTIVRLTIGNVKYVV